MLIVVSVTVKCRSILSLALSKSLVSELVEGTKKVPRGKAIGPFSKRMLVFLYDLAGSRRRGYLQKGFLASTSMFTGRDRTLWSGTFRCVDLIRKRKVQRRPYPIWSRSMDFSAYSREACMTLSKFAPVRVLMTVIYLR